MTHSSLKPHKIFFGWWLVAACVLIALYLAAVVFYGFTAFIEPMVDELGWSYTKISLGASLRGRFGRGNFGSIFGFLMGISVTGSILGPPMAAWVFDNWGSYQNVWLVVAGFAIVAMAFIWTMPKTVELISK